MRIAVAADERTGVADAVVEALRARGHELPLHGALSAGRARRLGVGLRGRRARRRRGPRRPGRRVLLDRAPARRSRPTRCAASAPRCAPTRPRRPAPAAGTTPTCSPSPCAHRRPPLLDEILDAWFDGRPVARRRTTRPTSAHLAEIEAPAERIRAAAASRPARSARPRPSSRSAISPRLRRSRSTWPSTSRQRQVGLRDRDVAPQRLGDLVRRARRARRSAAAIFAARRSCSREALVDQLHVVGDRLAVAGQDESSRHLARLAQRVACRSAARAARPPPGSPDLPPSGREISGLEEMWAIRWSPASSDARAPRPRRRCPTASAPGGAGPRSRRSRELERLAVAQRARRPCAEPPQPRNERDTARSAVDDVARDPVAQHQRLGELVVALGVGPRSPRSPARAGRARTTSAPERRARMSTSPRWSMCWWVMTIRSRSSIAAPVRGERALELVERLAGVRARVDERQRVVLDQVAVDAARPRTASGSAGGGCPARARRAPAGSARRLTSGSARAPRRAWRSMSSSRDERLQAQAQQRLGVRGAHVEVPVVVVDRDAVEVRDARASA